MNTHESDVIAVKPVCQDWQQDKCTTLKLALVRGNGRRYDVEPRCIPADQPLRTSQIKGDGNCLFRAFSAVITGSQDDHALLRTMTVSYNYAEQSGHYATCLSQYW